MSLGQSLRELSFETLGSGITLPVRIVVQRRGLLGSHQPAPHKQVQEEQPTVGAQCPQQGRGKLQFQVRNEPRPQREGHEGHGKEDKSVAETRVERFRLGELS